jgi:hypothetical protein
MSVTTTTKPASNGPVRFGDSKAPDARAMISAVRLKRGSAQFAETWIGQPVTVVWKPENGPFTPGIQDPVHWQSAHEDIQGLHHLQEVLVVEDHQITACRVTGVVGSTGAGLKHLYLAEAYKLPVGEAPASEMQRQHGVKFLGIDRQWGVTKRRPDGTDEVIETGLSETTAHEHAHVRNRDPRPK